VFGYMGPAASLRSTWLTSDSQCMLSHSHGGANAQMSMACVCMCEGVSDVYHLLACAMYKVLGIRAFIFLYTSVLHNLVSTLKETNKMTASC